MGTAIGSKPLSSVLRMWVGDIRFWVVIAFLVRLIGITNPPLEISHHWRQTLVLSVARNYAEGGIDVLHPRMDTGGDLTGITGMEFPLLNVFVAWGMMLFGEVYWPGRLIVLIMGSAGILAFHRIVARRLGERTGLFAALLLLVSLWFMYGRKVMPDVPALALVLVALERFDASLKARAIWPSLALGTLCLIAGLLSKISAGVLLAVWPVLAFSQRSGPRTRVATTLIALAVLPALWWYFYWVPHLVDTYGYWHFFMGGTLSDGVVELLRNWPRVLDNFYFDAMRFSGSAAFLLGLYHLVRGRHKGLAISFALLAAAFLVIMLKAGDNFWVHAYYVLPFIPVMALVGGYGLARLNDTRWATGLMVVVALEGFAAQANDFTISPMLEPLLRLERDLGDHHGLIAMNTGDGPTPMYFAHRKGWTLTNAKLQNTELLSDLAKRGCGRIVIFRDLFETDVKIPWPVVFENATYRIHAAPDRGKNTPSTGSGLPH